MTRGERGAEKSGKLAPAERGGDTQGIVEDRAVPCERAVDRLALSFQSALVDAGAVTGKARTAAAEQGGGDGRSRRGVADPHFAQDDEIGFGRERVISRRYGFEKRASSMAGPKVKSAVG